MERLPQSSENSGAGKLLHTMILLDVAAFGIAPLLLWGIAAAVVYGFRGSAPWLIYLAPTEGFLGYGMLNCVPLELVRIGLIVFGVRVRRGRRASLRLFLLLLIGLALIEPLAAGGLLAISNQGGAVWASLIGHSLITLVLVALTFYAVSGFRFSADGL